MELESYKYYYFLGIGGIGMSALARYLLFKKKFVIGYDKTPSEITHLLEKEGVKIIYVDDPCLLPSELTPDNTLVIYTPAIPNDCQLKKYFQKNRFTLSKRAELLAKLVNEAKLFAIAGTHGKTTTSTMLAHILLEANIPCYAFLGGIALNYHSNFLYAGNSYAVTEADEFDRSFLHLRPTYGAITSTDADHLDIYQHPEELHRTFQQFANQCKKVFVKSNLKISHDQKITYDFDAPADYYGTNYRWEEPWVFFDYYGKHTLRNIKWKIPGKHNAENAVLAISMALEIGVEKDIILRSLENFQGIHRRFNLHHPRIDKWIVDDYAHHPAEIQACLSAVRELFPNKKLLTVFQPHLFSRTKDFMEAFASELSKTDQLLLIHIYPAREKPIKGITSEVLAQKINLTNVMVSDLNGALTKIVETDAEVVAILGAGNVDSLVQPLIQKWSQ